MKHVTEQLQLFVSGELDGPQRNVVEDHLNSCPSCRSKSDHARRLWDELEAVGSSPTRESVWPAVQARTFGAGKGEREWFFGSGGLARGALAATALAAGLTLGVLVPASESPEGYADDPGTESVWLSDASWLSDSSWLGGGGAPGIDDLLLGAARPDEVDGS